MKKSILVLALITISVVSQAQNFGLRFGGIMAKEKISIFGFGAANLNAYGFQAGAFYELPQNETFAVQPEILVNYFANNAGFASQVTEINLPVLGKFTVAPKTKLLIGPQLDFLASTKVSSIDFETQFEKFGFSGVVGAEYAFNESFSASLRYTAMLKGFKTKILDFTNSSTVGFLGNILNPTFKTPIVALTIGYTFPSKNKILKPNTLKL